MNIYANMVVKNEACRYLDKCLIWLSDHVDGIFVYDDQSTDATATIAQEWAIVVVRPDEVPSFLSHEAACRDAGWKAMEDALKPTHGEDWILCLDADEFLVDERGERSGMEEEIEKWKHMSSGLSFPIREVFGSGSGKAFIRVDGYWDAITGLRLVRYKQNGSFFNRSFAGGSVPAYVYDEQVIQLETPDLLHFGYADAVDRRIKAQRYSNLPGHNRNHVNSILRPGVLEEWKGKTPW